MRKPFQRKGRKSWECEIDVESIRVGGFASEEEAQKFFTECTETMQSIRDGIVKSKGVEFLVSAEAPVKEANKVAELYLNHPLTAIRPDWCLCFSEEEVKRWQQASKNIAQHADDCKCNTDIEKGLLKFAHQLWGAGMAVTYLVHTKGQIMPDEWITKKVGQLDGTLDIWGKPINLDK